jgi:hypothetical protein
MPIVFCGLVVALTIDLPVDLPAELKVCLRMQCKKVAAQTNKSRLRPFK